MFDPPPTADEILGLMAPCNPFHLDRYTDRIDRCGRKRQHYYEAGYESGQTMCGYLRCPTCAQWRIDHSRNGWSYRKLYKDLSPALFSGHDAIYWQPFRLVHDEMGTRKSPKVRSMVGERLKARDGKAKCVEQFGDVLHYLSTVDLALPGDTWPSRRLSPDDARSFFFDVLLQVGTLAHKPTACRAPEWGIRTDKEIAALRKSETRIGLGCTLDDVDSQVRRFAADLLDESRPDDVAPDEWETTENVKLCWEAAREYILFGPPTDP